MKRTFIKLSFDLRRFDEQQYVFRLDQCQKQGIKFASLEQLGDTEENLRRVYELNKLCAKDIPGRGEFFTYEEFCERRYGAHYDPAGVIIALIGDNWIGMSATSHHSEKGFCFNEMTGVIQAYRRRGVALALKLLGIRFAKGTGVQKVFTIQDKENTSAISMNRKLGYTDVI